MSLEDRFIPLRDELARNLYIEFCGRIMPIDYLKLAKDDQMFWITIATRILERLEDYGFYSREIGR